MTELTRIELEALALNYQDLVASPKTLMLSTASLNGIPDISYTPFVRSSNGAFYIFVSKLTSHTINLLNNPQASLLFIKSEVESPNLFARERAILNCRAQKIERGDSLYNEQLNALQDKFGNVVGLLRTLSDFHLFALQPISGRYVVGFGRAFTIDTANNSLHPI
ncbi:MAG: pyridoxamine 5'-phosphate oxidase family protein [Methylococcales bacterium]